MNSRQYRVTTKDKDFNVVDEMIVEEANGEYHTFILAKLSGIKTGLYFRSQKYSKDEKEM